MQTIDRQRIKNAYFLHIILTYCLKISVQLLKTILKRVASLVKSSYLCKKYKSKVNIYPYIYIITAHFYLIDPRVFCSSDKMLSSVTAA